MLQRSSISTTPQIAILPYALSIFPFLCVSELYGTLSGHIFEETAERGLVFKSKNIGNFFSTFVAVKQKAFAFATPGNPRTGGSGSQTPPALQQ